ncbi:MAG: acetyl-CoA C-acetyltransferase [Sulfobacillus thermotolerans]|uniref:acetyl-CoA C-acetyltransferase n=1 Tax=Sulfobacillus thermotolerans TaxID=338644 RepID=A0ABN5H2D3_9FIRM|nr:acetyl-CoA acetyltransferase [Sulfobacillus thermotolerans]MCY0909142.1 acetyl-CoA C-acetyltransferase [Sulfobacillus thermotolerans]
MPETVVVSLARTPFTPFGGALKDVKATDLGAHAIREALKRAMIPGDAIDYVFMGQVLQAGAGQIPSRQASMGAGMPETVPSDTINKVCASSLRAVNLADMAIRAGEIQSAVAGGMESMSRAPYLVDGARFGLRMGDGALVDAAVHDGLWCSFGQCHMGVYGSEVAKEFGISREEQDEWAYRSHVRAIQATDSGRFAKEIAPLTLTGRRGEQSVIDHDLGPRRDTSLEKMRALKPVFVADGTVTAGNAPGLTDGAAVLVLMERTQAENLGLPILATIVSSGFVSRAPKYLHTVPAYAAEMALAKAGIDKSQLKLIEINEAFAAVTLTSIKVGEFNPEIVNVNGGAVALGHPIGASGARILMTLIVELQERGGGYGVAAICSGGGQGEATLVKVG